MALGLVELPLRRRLPVAAKDPSGEFTPLIMPTEPADLANELDRAWSPGRFGPHSRTLRILSAIRRRMRPDLAWELIASTAAPIASFGIAIWKVHEIHGTGWLFHAVWFLAVVWLIAVYKKWRVHIAGSGPTASARWQVFHALEVIAKHLPNRVRVRATWFRHDPVRDCLVPFSRWEPGRMTPDPRSRALYPRRVSYTGLGWAHPETLIVYRCGPFHSRPAMNDHYQSTIGIPKVLTDRIGGTMQDVRCIVTFGIRGPPNGPGLLGVLSIDFFEDQPTLYEQLRTSEHFRDAIEVLRGVEMNAQYRLSRR